MSHLAVGTHAARTQCNHRRGFLRSRSSTDTDLDCRLGKAFFSSPPVSKTDLGPALPPIRVVPTSTELLRLKFATQSSM
jgi:hypothetical protein